jgi:predicted enzyme related to lactoylglutathione lyase
MTHGVAQLGLVLDCSDPEGNEFCVCDGGQNGPTQ